MSVKVLQGLFVHESPQTDTQLKQQWHQRSTTPPVYSSRCSCCSSAGGSCKDELCWLPPDLPDHAHTEVMCTSASVWGSENAAVNVRRSGIRLTKKKAMKLKRLGKQAGKDGWKQGTASSFHSKGKKKKRAA